MRDVLAVAVSLLTLSAGEARADSDTWISMPGNSREIPRTFSASRDAVSGLVFAPRVAAKGAADFAFAKIDLGGVEPLASVFGEALLVNHNLNGANDGGFGGLLVGAALPGALGELLPYDALDVGNGNGLLINRREITLAIGVRYAPF